MTARERYVQLVTRRYRQLAPGPPWDLLDGRSDEQLSSDFNEVDGLSKSFELDSNERVKLEMIRGWISQAMMIRRWQREPPALFA